MPSSFNIVERDGEWIVKNRFSSSVKTRVQTKAAALRWARSNLPVGSRVYVYYATRSGLDYEFTLRGK